MNTVSLIPDYPVESFRRCHICNFTSDDMCEFSTWYECDEHDNLTDKVLITCQSKECQKVIDDHRLLYIGIPWGQGMPGHFVRICDNCSFRDNTKCTNPIAKSNGGPGLEIKFSDPLPGVRTCFTNSKTMNYMGQMHPVSHSCQGFSPKKK